MSESFARFVFPLEDSSRFTWNRPSPYAYEGAPEYYWSIEWETPEARRGLDPSGLDVGVSWKARGTKTGSLVDLIRGATVTVHTDCLNCGDIPAYVPSHDRSVRAEVVENRVVITIRGRDAVSRIFPGHADSVWLARQTPAVAGEVQVTVPVRDTRVTSYNTR